MDGDTSTNDACTLSATGASGVDIHDCVDEFQQALNEVTQSLAYQIIKDGEGATKFVEVCVKGGASSEDCLEVAYTVAHSPLVKTALFASDANWGRILAAVGRANISNLKIEDINIYLNEVSIIQAGEPDEHYTEEAGSNEMAKEEIIITIEIGKVMHKRVCGPQIFHMIMLRLTQSTVHERVSIINFLPRCTRLSCQGESIYF
ncbi:MAG: N-acetylglutamate synthase [uncultured Candidatus Thioglobus sp.]|nr:MAG: N-acetylglutamate synthase [uncultured Candidatus Thioglobus sp.]